MAGGSSFIETAAVTVATVVVGIVTVMAGRAIRRRSNRIMVKYLASHLERNLQAFSTHAQDHFNDLTRSNCLIVEELATYFERFQAVSTVMAYCLSSFDVAIGALFLLQHC